MRVNIEVLTPEGAIVAARVAAAIAAAMNGEAPAVTTTTRTRRTKAEIEADKAAEIAAATVTYQNQHAMEQPVETKPDPVAQYLDMTSSAQPDTAKPSNPPADTAAGTVDPMDAVLAGASAPTKTRDEMIAAIVKLMGEKGVLWAREHIIAKYSATKFADMADEKLLLVYNENCV